jgi:F-type H+-transporting ATPase subunit delta
VFENEGNVRKFFVSSGSVTINEDASVQILAEEAHPLEDLDLAEVKKALAEAQADLNKASTDVEKAEAQIAIEVAEELVKAIGQ